MIRIEYQTQRLSLRFFMLMLVLFLSRPHSACC